MNPLSHHSCVSQCLTKYHRFCRWMSAKNTVQLIAGKKMDRLSSLPQNRCYLRSLLSSSVLVSPTHSEWAVSCGTCRHSFKTQDILMKRNLTGTCTPTSEQWAGGISSSLFPLLRESKIGSLKHSNQSYRCWWETAQSKISSEDGMYYLYKTRTSRTLKLNQLVLQQI